MAERTDEFFVGYAPAPPPGVRRVVRRAVLGIACLTIAVPLALVLAQGPFAPARFEFGTTRTFRGTIQAHPVATLVMARPGGPSGDVSSLLLVAPGKHGAQDEIRGHDHQAVELSGTLVYREGQTMIELEPGSIVASAQGAATPGPVQDLGPVRLAGEIVDTKCHLGVMNPGDGKTHRDCAARCISGGVPPALRVREPSGESRLLLLVGRDGEAINDRVLPYVAEPVEIAGRAERRDDLLLLYADPATIRRLGEEG